MDDTGYLTISSGDLAEIAERMGRLDDHALIRLVAVEQSDYTMQAIDIARNELHRRGLDVLSDEQYYEQFPLERVLPSGFCMGCYLQTTGESLAGTSTFNLVGTRLIGGFFDRCPICGSVLQERWYCLIVPVFPLGQYRVLYRERSLFYSRYLGRKLRKKATQCEAGEVVPQGSPCKTCEIGGE
jgi:hypothetical protein